jgi:hypothetical protein
MCPWFSLPHCLLPIFLLAFPAPAAAPASSLFGKVMCGYQGWFATPQQDAELGWFHYGFDRPGRCQIDLWPDLSEFPAEERFDTPLNLPDGRPAQVFSSAHAGTVRRHFEWMREYGIDGVFLQRFGTVLKDPRLRAHADRVLQNVRKAAHATGRSWAVMYDLTGLAGGEIESVVMEDWKRLRRDLRILEDAQYQRHAGKAVVGVWGIGFSDNRRYTLSESQALLRFLHDNPEFGGVTTVAGVPWHWRTLNHDATSDPQLYEVLSSADIISPWAVGRYANPADAASNIAAVHAADSAFCGERGQEYLPVIFPGFSWRNLMKARGEEAPLNAIPRLGGEFLWSQAAARIRAGSTMLYVAMFDEMDEATAIFKTTSQVPVGAEGFVTEAALPSDHYLWLSGAIGRALRRETPLTKTVPMR